MDVIRLKIYGDIIKVSVEKTYLGNINTCRMDEQGNFIFSKDYLERKYNLLHFYIAPLVNKNRVTKIILDKKCIIPIIKNLLNLLETIRTLEISEDIEINMIDKDNISELNYIDEINCYDMELKLYNYLEKKNKTINLRSEVLFQSNLMIENGINNITKLCHIKEITIGKKFENEEKEELEYLLKNNNCLEKIKIEKYSKELIDYLKYLIKGRNILITVVNDNNIEEKDFKYLKNIKKETKLNLELEYSNQYKQKHIFKQLNINLLRLCMVMIIFACVGFVSTEQYLLNKDKTKTEEITKQYESVIDVPVVEEEKVVEEPVVNEASPEVTTPSYVSPYYKTYSHNFEELKNINSDTVGWITVNNTKVNYPVVKSNNNDYYLNHSFDKSQNSFGWIYADYRSNFDILNQNTIIYGHNVLGTDLLFSSLTNTLNSAWYNNPNNLTITFNTEKESIKWQIFSIYLIPVTNDYLITNFNSGTSFLNFVQKLKDRSIKDFGVEVKENDKMITLSTCYKDSSNRVVIHAKKIN